MYRVFYRNGSLPDCPPLTSKDEAARWIIGRCKDNGNPVSQYLVVLEDVFQAELHRKGRNVKRPWYPLDWKDERPTHNEYGEISP